MQKKRIILFDTITDGHHPDYLYNLMLYYGGNSAIELWVITGEYFTNYLKQFQPEGKSAWENIFFRLIPQKEIDALHQKSIYQRSIIEWNLMLKHAEDLDADHVLVMYLDYFQLGIILGKTTNLSISGIYFRPNFTQNTHSLYGKIKKLVLKLAMNTGKLKHLFVLEAPVQKELQKLSSKVQVHVLCEPVQCFDVNEEERQKFAQKYPQKKPKIDFLNFGYLDERKGIEVFLEACQHLSSEQIEHISLTLVGPVHPEYQSKIEAQIAQVKDLEVRRIWGYLPAREVQMAFDSTDWVLVLYRNHLGSSSVLVRAALAGKPVLSTHLGQIGQLTNTQDLGAVVDILETKDLANLLVKIIDQKMEIHHASIEKFASENSIKAFGDAINQALQA
jgi:glycosyltransferase involved in cell wall biosynthesis